MIPILDEILKLGNKVIPDKNSQMEFEKKIIEVNQEIIKNNKSLLDRIVPITFPLCVWTLIIFAFAQLGVGFYSLKTKGTWLTIPFPEEISQLAFVFVCGLVGKWNIKEFTTGRKNRKERKMREFINKIMPALVTTLIVTTATTWFANSRQLEENKGSIIKIAEDLEKIEKSHTRRLENLEHSKETMPDYYVTRREFNVIIGALDEKMNKVDKNIEKLLDLQMEKNKG